MGNRYAIFGYAVDASGRLRGIADLRVRTPGAAMPTRSARRRWLQVSWPDSSAGARRAAEWSGRANARRVGR